MAIPYGAPMPPPPPPLRPPPTMLPQGRAPFVEVPLSYQPERHDVQYSDVESYGKGHTHKAKKNSGMSKILYEGHLIEKSRKSPGSSDLGWKEVSVQRLNFDTEKLLTLSRKHKQRTGLGPVYILEHLHRDQRDACNKIISLRQKRTGIDWVFECIRTIPSERSSGFFSPPAKVKAIEVILRSTDEIRRKDDAVVVLDNELSDSDIARNTAKGNKKKKVGKAFDSRPGLLGPGFQGGQRSELPGQYPPIGPPPNFVGGLGGAPAARTTGPPLGQYEPFRPPPGPQPQRMGMGPPPFPPPGVRPGRAPFEEYNHPRTPRGSRSSSTSSDDRYRGPDRGRHSDRHGRSSRRLSGRSRSRSNEVLKGIKHLERTLTRQNRHLERRVKEESRFRAELAEDLADLSISPQSSPRLGRGYPSSFGSSRRTSRYSTPATSLSRSPPSSYRYPRYSGGSLDSDILEEIASTKRPRQYVRRASHGYARGLDAHRDLDRLAPRPRLITYDRDVSPYPWNQRRSRDLPPSFIRR